jgi:H(+)-translocating pyrophosphatase
MTIDSWEPIDQVSVGIAAGALSLVAAGYFVKSVRSEEVKNERLSKLQQDIQAGAKAFLHTEYKWLAIFCIVVFGALCGVLYQDDNEVAGVYTGICFLVGALFSAFAGYAGMLIATDANARTTVACERSISDGLSVSFASGAVMSNTVVGLGLVGVSVLYLIFEQDGAQAWEYISGFGFGASSIALFARVGGGVFTKAADVGADLVGKVENAIPEDDPRNPAVIADNVGDNVGDVAGMGADLFESYVGSIIAAATLAAQDYPQFPELVALPFWIAGFGIVASMVGTVLVRSAKLDDKATLEKLLKTINWGISVAAVFVIGFTILVAYLLVDEQTGGTGMGALLGSDSDTDGKVWRIVGCVLIGLAAGIIIGQFTEYCTSYETSPTRDISAASEFGAAPVIIKGLGVGMMSVTVPTIAIAITVLGCNEMAGLYGVALSAVGMLSTLGITLATDAYGPVADNAGGLAEMAGLPDEIRSRTDKLDSLGNTTAATGKGFAIGSAVLTSVGLIAAFTRAAGLEMYPVDLKQPLVLVGVLIGAMLPFVFAALTMLSVDRSARSIITEVRRQFGECPELLDSDEDPTRKITKNGVEYPDHGKCVAIATSSAIEEMLLPGSLAVFVPVIIGFLLGPMGLAGLLVGSLTSGFMLALTMSNAGGAWDNAKKWVEKCAAEGEPTAQGGNTFANFGRKKAAEGEEVTDELSAMLDLYKERHSAVVTGDTVGDPFKDTSGPALNILIKLMSVVSLVLGPAFAVMYDDVQDVATGFAETGTLIGAIVGVVIAALLFIAVRTFAKNNAKRAADAEAAADLIRQHAAAAAAEEEEEAAEAKEVDAEEVDAEVA